MYTVYEYFALNNKELYQYNFLCKLINAIIYGSLYINYCYNKLYTFKNIKKKGDIFTLVTNDISISQNTKSKAQVHTVTAESMRLGILLATVGGFLDAYTFICRGGVFANAQTGNIVLLGVDIAKGNFRQAFMVLLPILAFILGAIVCEFIKELTSPSITLVTGSERIILIIEIIVLITIGFLPDTVPDIFVTVVISFVCSVQICSFTKLVDSPYNTAMCTANLRSACQSAYAAFRKKDKKLTLKANRYIKIVFSFITGGALSGMLTLSLGGKSIWFAAMILTIALILFTIDDFRFRNSDF